MAVDVSAPHSRRALLGAALGGVGALFANALGRATPVAAADGDAVLLGKGSVQTDNAAASATIVNTSADPGFGVVASSQDANALSGRSQTGVGVFGTSAASGGARYTGIIGTTSETGVVAPDTSFTGVYGFSEDPDNFAAVGVWGDSDSGTGVAGSGFTGVYGTGVIGTMGDVIGSRTGVYGFAGSDVAPVPQAGAGVVGRSGTGATYGVVGIGPGTTQFAVYVAGRLKVSTRAGGRTTIGSTATSRKITLAGVTSASFVVATLQTSVSGCYVRAVVPATGSFTIYLSKAPGKTVAVGYVIVN